MSRTAGKSGIYNPIKKVYPLSQKGTTKQQVFVLECGHAVLDRRETVGTLATKERETKWCFLCTEAKRKADERKRKQEKAERVAQVAHVAPQLPPGTMLLTEAQLAKIVAKASEKAVDAALDKLTAPTVVQPAPVFPTPEDEAAEVSEVMNAQTGGN